MARLSERVARLETPFGGGMCAACRIEVELGGVVHKCTHAIGRSLADVLRELSEEVAATRPIRAAAKQSH